MSGTRPIAAPGIRHVFIRDMIMHAAIGVYAHEHGAMQRVRLNIDLAVAEDGLTEDCLSRVVDYEAIVVAVRGIVSAGHVVLVETLAERIAMASLADERVINARVRVEKLDVFADMTSVGVEVERRR